MTHELKQARNAIKRQRTKIKKEHKHKQKAVHFQIKKSLAQERIQLKKDNQVLNEKLTLKRTENRRLKQELEVAQKDLHQAKKDLDNERTKFFRCNECCEAETYENAKRRGKE